MATVEAAEKKEKKFKNVSIIKEGNQIIIPDGMGYAQARDWLTKQEQSEEQLVSVSCQIDGFPLDGVIALAKAMDETYGFTALSDRDGFWGPEPPMLVQIPIADGSFVSAPLGKMKPPKYEGGCLEALCQGMALTVIGTIKRKFEPEVKQVLERAKVLLREQSIYKGNAIILDLSWMNQNPPRFHPINDAPKFMDVSEVNESGLILNQHTMHVLEANVFMLVEDSEGCRKNGIGLKYGVVLAGRYGTGKTLTARVMASKAVRNGWTYIYLKTGNRIATALKLAEHYAPAVVFTEDIDDIVCGERNQYLNEILNTMDGVDTKDKPIITIVTTNHPDKINQACLRPGRIDKVIRYHEPDAETAVKFVQMYSKDDDDKSLLAKDVDLNKVGEAMAGFVPAFIAEAVQMAKRFAMYRNKGGIGAGVTTEDLLYAAEEAKDQIDMMNRKDSVTYEEKSHAALQHLGQVILNDNQALPNFTRNGN